MIVQFKKGVLEMCILALIDQKDYTGYQLVKEITQSIKVSEGAIYPILREFVHDGLLETYFIELNEPKKCYRLTSKGIEAKETLTSEWYDLTGRINFLIQEAKENE